MEREQQIQALADAILNNTNPNRFYSLPNGNAVALPTGQGTGTYTQKKTYAEQKAREVFNSNC